MKRPKTTTDLLNAANPDNPRTITEEQLAALLESMEKFGDLSGLIFNRKTGRTVGGHQRVKLLNAPISVVKKYSKPTKTGTVAEGFVTLKGERFVYREVDWDEVTERAAMVAANKHGGDWDDFKLKELLGSLKSDDFPVTLTGFSEAELSKILATAQPPNEFGKLDENIPIQHVCPKCGYKWSGKPS